MTLMWDHKFFSGHGFGTLYLERLGDWSVATHCDAIVVVARSLPATHWNPDFICLFSLCAGKL